MELLASLASVAALKLRNIELLERDAQRRQMEAELALARHIQVSLLPETLPTFDGLVDPRAQHPVARRVRRLLRRRSAQGRRRVRPVHGRRVGQGHRGVDRDRVARGAGRGADRERRAARRDLRPALPPSLQAHAAGEVRHRLLRRARARDRPSHLHQRRPQHGAAGSRRRHHRGAHHLRAADRAAARGHLRVPRDQARARAPDCCSTPTASPRPRTRPATSTASIACAPSTPRTSACRSPTSPKRSRTR